MATVAEIQAELFPEGIPNRIRLIKQVRVGTTDTWYAVGGIIAVGKAKWVTSTNTDSAAAQAADIVTAMTS